MSKEYTEYLSELLREGSASILTFLYRRASLLIFSYLITSLSSAATYGYLSVLLRIQSTYARFVSYWLSANTRTLPRLDNKHFNDVARLGLLVSIAIFTSISFLIYLFWDEIIQRTVLSQSHSDLIVPVIICLFATTILFYCTSVYKSERKIRRAMIFSQIMTPSSLVLATIFVWLFFRINTSNIWSGFTVLILICCFIAILIIRETVNFTDHIDITRDVIEDYLSFMLYTGTSGIFILSHRDIVFALMAVFLSPVSAGLFSLCLILAKISRWSLSGINQIFPAIASSLYDNGKSDIIDQLYKSTSKIATTIACIPFIFASAYHKQILTLFSSQYAADSYVLVVALGAQVIATVIGSVGLLLLMTDNEKISFYVSVSNAFLMIPISIYLTTNYGVLGLAFSFLFTMTYNNFAEMGILYHREKLWPVTINHVYILFITVILSIINILTVTMFPSIVALPLCILSSLSITVISYMYFYTEEEKKSIISVVN